MCVIWILFAKLERCSLALVCACSGQQLTIEQEQLGYRGLGVVLDPAVTDVQTGGSLVGVDDYQCVCVLVIECVTITVSKGQTDTCCYSLILAFV